MKRHLYRYLWLMLSPALVIASSQPAIYYLPTLVQAPKISPDISSNQRYTGFPSIITSKQLQQQGDTSLGQALSHVAGLNIFHGAGSNPSLSLRGFGSQASSNTLVLLDGQPINSITLEAANINAIPLEQIKAIEVLTGSASVLYGNHAVGGVINIITNTVMKDDASVQLQTGMPRQDNINAQFAKRLGSTWGIAGGVTDHSQQGYRDHSKQDLKSVNLQLNQHDQTQYNQWQVAYSDQYNDYPGSLSEQALNNNRQAASPTGQGWLDNQTVTLSWRHQTRLNQTWRWLFTSQYQHQQANGQWFFTPVSTVSIHAQHWQLHPKFIADGFWLKRPWQWQIGSDISQYHYRYLLSGRPYTDARQNQQSFYTLGSIDLRKHWQASGGVRYYWIKQNSQLHQQQQHFAGIASTIGLNYQPNAHWRWYVRRADSYRLPLVDEYQYITGQPIAINADLQVQTGVSYELGGIWRHQSGELQFNLYRLIIHNEITYDPNGGKNVNLDKSIHDGLLIHVKQQLNHYWRLQASLSLMNNRLVAGPYSGKKIPWTTPITSDWQLNYRIRQHWQWFIAGHYIGQRYAIGDLSRQQRSFGDITTWDSGVSYDQKNWFVTLRINNLTNRDDNDYVSFYAPSTFAFYPAPGINGSISLGYHFV